MLITDVDERSLPLFAVETLRGDGEWHVFTGQPFASEAEAAEYLCRMRVEYPALLNESNSRVGPAYTKGRWREDLIDAVMRDPDACRRALYVLRNSSLVELLR